MTVSAIQKSDNRPKRINYLEAAAAGAIVGYSLKYILPITSQEKDENFKSALKEIRTEAETAKQEAINDIRKDHSAPCSDEFLRMYDNKEIKFSKVKSLNESKSRHILNLITKVNDNARESIRVEKRALIARTKDIRPTHVFIFTGIIIGLIITATYNLMKAMAKSKAEAKAQNQTQQNIK